MALSIDLLSDLRSILTEDLVAVGARKPLPKDLNELLEYYFNVEAKLISEQPRLVVESTELQSNLPKDPFLSSYLAIKKKVEAGELLTPHLSRKSLHGKSADFLLNDWALHHIHLSMVRENPSDYFFKRSDYLLFGWFTDRTAYFLDIRPHSEQNVFSRQDYIRIIQKNWPDALKPFQLQGVHSLAQTFTDSELQELRKAGLNILTEVDGAVFAPIGGGISSAGTRTWDTMKADQWIKFFETLQDNLIQNEELLRRQIQNARGIAPLHTLKLTLIRPDSEFLIVDSQHTFSIPIEQ